ncbi:hypothetical protein AGABI1DRAFT_129629 [Agaricus bisporus var. burnettii JB137-S8]|uniref:SAP domain-containing protein n=1 Tax=Agaricus bisporus var. burnettii (strain JB137-S8 / ATCC MYA-4627 / FGSC 10392) TaxID=597362 RepID=K5XTZ2_AGABU|nr:uncharacterized protein AGABI1DRAFT_129629 [Agaricus bisporus var. burnettii JB137-S8]EKM78530.1 hypothetical protein AGABI1DRAFT_129629 [Agaricus bisporus var. burnettii JB137-S8]
MNSSPALDSLRRSELQTLCKSHAIKANGKNSDLLHRLRQHARDLPHDHPLSIAARMDSIQELEESDPIDLPGCISRPGVQAPDNARLSLGLDEAMPLPQPTTTLRLVSSTSHDTLSVPPNQVFLTPKLKPVETTFDLVITPGKPSAVSNFWAPDANMYPKLTIDDLPPTSTLSVPTTDPFIFGSPLPKHSISNTQFKTAATTVLEEMNQRLRSEGVEGVGMDIMDKLKQGAHTQEDLERENKRPMQTVKEKRRKGEITKKFDEVHQAGFDKMEGIVRKGVAPLVIGKKRPAGTTSNERPGKKARMDDNRDDNAMNVDNKEHERIKRKLDMSRAKRKSSGVGTAARKTTVARKEKEKPKFGFLASAKKFVTSMWGKKPVTQPVKKLDLEKKTITKEQGQVKAKANSLGGRIGNNARLPTMTMGTTTRPRAMTVNDAERKRVDVSSRLLAPTASSLAKMKTVSLGTITNRTTSTTTEKKKGGLVPKATSLNNAPTVGKIFRKPLMVTSGVTGIPVPVLKKKGGGDEGKMDVDVNGGEMKVSGVVRQRTLTRKPRISRSKVIAKLASQRAAASSIPSSITNARVVSGPSSRPQMTGTPVSKGFRPTLGGGGGRRLRSSLGEAKRGRASIAGGGGGGMGLNTPGKRERSVVVSAKKRLRQSEIARRRSKVNSCGE